MNNSEMYAEALKNLYEKKADYDEKGIYTFACTEGVALFLLAISPNGVLHVTEYTPWRIKAGVRPEATPEGVELHFSIPNVKGKISALSSYVNYILSVRDCVYEMQNIIDEKINKAKIEEALGSKENDNEKETE